MTSPETDKKQLAEKFFRSRLVVTLMDLHGGDARKREMAEAELARLKLTEREARRRLSQRLPR